jgi:hypothetical protein
MAAFGSKATLGTSIAESLWDMCFHFIGPHEVTMDASGQAYVLKCVEELGTLGTFNAEFGKRIATARAVVATAEKFFEMGLWYKRAAIINGVVQVYSDTLDGCFYKKTLAFRSGRDLLLSSLKRLLRLLAKSYPRLTAPRRQVEALLSRYPRQ